ncbi:hypothetical protein EST38_g5913 [Candolleomyces aberdarensis]|uniref:Uncharacterized protein n=1 Tax=Candolleomyces aberdarensis TaxID=2316362 RepID=A0A4Q2DJA5_9AGAR|nr:hypothetical protein EST38_g5913 [Candolleomyces aberdarensis]
MDSPFACYFNTNYVPSDEQVPAIREVIRTGEEALNDIDKKIHDLMEGRMEEHKLEELQALAELREGQERAVERHKALLSPIKTVNDDILTSIFLIVLEQRVSETESGDPYSLTISARHPAVIVSHVCRRWRDTALSTKLLWRHLHVWIPIYPSWIRDHDTWRAKVTKLVGMTREWISRSDTCHLGVEIREWNSMLFKKENSSLIAECVEFRELVDVLCSSSPRWKDLDLEIDLPQARFPDFPTMRLLAPPQSTSILTNARIYFWSTLEHLIFHGYPTESGHRFDALQASNLFENCPNLVTCYLALQKDDTVTVASSRAPISLPRLRELSLLPHQIHLPQGFASSLILPSLRKLMVLSHGWGSPRNQESSGLVEFFERFGSTLEDVTFCYAPLTASALHYCLQHLPNVVSLELVRRSASLTGEPAARLDSHILMDLSPTFDGTGTRIARLPLCPNIEEFKFDTGGDRLAGRDLVDFIEARRREVTVEGGMTVARLREVDCGGYVFQDVDPVQELRRRGVDVDTGDFSLKNFSAAA